MVLLDVEVDRSTVKKTAIANREAMKPGKRTYVNCDSGVKGSCLGLRKPVALDESVGGAEDETDGPEVGD